MDHDVKYVGCAVHPHIKDRMVYLYKCKNCHKPFGRPMQGAFMPGECDYIQAAPAADNAALAARVRGLGQALAFWPKAARLLAEVATRLEATQVKVDPGAPEGDQTGKFWFHKADPFASGGFASTARRTGRTSFHEEFVSRREEEEAMRRAQEATMRQSRAYSYGSSAFREAAEFARHSDEEINEMARRHAEAMLRAKMHVPLTAEELDEMYGEKKPRKTRPEQPYYRQNQRY